MLRTGLQIMIVAIGVGSAHTYSIDTKKVDNLSMTQNHFNATSLPDFQTYQEQIRRKS